MFATASLDVVIPQVSGGQELLRHTEQSIGRPGTEPVDGAAVDQRGELAAPEHVTTTPLKQQPPL